MKIPKIPEFTDVEIVFGSSKHMPKYTEIPNEFKDTNNNKWVQAQIEWFYHGVKKDQFKVKEGVDAEKAFRSLQAIQASFEPKHEHKEAGVAFLMSQYFDDYTPKTKI